MERNTHHGMIVAQKDCTKVWDMEQEGAENGQREEPEVMGDKCQGNPKSRKLADSQTGRNNSQTGNWRKLTGGSLNEGSTGELAGCKLANADKLTG